VLPSIEWDRRAVAGVDQIKKYTKSTVARLKSMVDALTAIEAEGIAGDVVECGVWRGGNIMLARMLAPSRVCWLYDTFDGMTEPDPDLDVKCPERGEGRAIDRYRNYLVEGRKWDSVSVDDVAQGFAELGISLDRVHFVAGPVETSLDTVAPLRIAILRLDMDWHLPTKVALQKLYPRIVPGGFLIVDDYGHWAGCKKAVDDYFRTAAERKAGGNTEAGWMGVLPPFYDVDYSCRVFRK
jgi:O-methyltransferase